MHKHETTWIVIVDGSRARIVTPDAEGSRLELVTELGSDAAHIPAHEIGTDRLGRVQESQYSGRHSIEPRQDPHEQRKVDFVRAVALHLTEASREYRFDRMVLFAPPRDLGVLRGAR